MKIPVGFKWVTHCITSKYEQDFFWQSVDIAMILEKRQFKKKKKQGEMLNAFKEMKNDKMPELDRLTAKYYTFF